MEKTCSICGCELTRGGKYARPTVEGRSHATRHHFVAERFFGRSRTGKAGVRESIFEECPWPVERQTAVFCYECHEELIHNPIFLPEDVGNFAALVRRHGLNEVSKNSSRDKLAKRILLLHEVIERGIASLLREPYEPASLKDEAGDLLE
jgi:hypothetical protein